jgi:hypothetical protein
MHTFILSSPRLATLSSCVLFALCLVAYLLGGLTSLALHGDLARILTPSWWRHPGYQPLAHMDWLGEVQTIFFNNTAILIIASLLPGLFQGLLKAGWAARLYPLALGFSAGLSAGPGGLPAGGYYWLAILPVALLELGVYTQAVCSRGRDWKLLLGLLLLAAVIEAGVQFYWL